MTFTWKQEKRDINVFHSFYLKAYADSPQRMTINTNSHSLIFPLGVVVQQSIQLSVLDAYNNTVCSIDPQRLVIKAINQKIIIDDKSLKKVKPRSDNNNNSVQNNTSFVISNIKLLPNPSLPENDSVIENTRLEFSIQGFEEIKETIEITVVNGIPSVLKWLSPHKCLTLMNNKRLEIRIQVCDAFNNPVVCGVDSQLTVTLVLGQDFSRRELTTQANENGVAIFSELIHIEKNRRSSQCVKPIELEPELYKSCSTNCFGLHKIQAITKLKQKVIKSTHHWLHITCDNKNPILIEYKIHGSPKVIAKSREMPTFTVHLFAEDKSLIYGFDSNKIEMHLIDTKDETNYQVFPPYPPFKETFRFRVDRAPLPGIYKIKFVCYGVQQIEKEVTLNEYLNVVPDFPVKLMVRSEALKNIVVVTNVGEKRSILESPLVLDLVDRNDISISDNISVRELENNPLYFGTLIAKIIK